VTKTKDIEQIITIINEGIWSKSFYPEVDVNYLLNDLKEKSNDCRLL